MGKRKVFRVILDIVLIGLFISFAYQYNQERKNKDIGQYTHCIEWDGWIYREDLIWNCYNFREQTLVCDWKIDENNILILYNPENKSEYYSQSICTAYAKTIRPYIDDIPTIEDIVLT